MHQHARRRIPRHTPPALAATQDLSVEEAIVTLLYAAADMLGSPDPEQRRRASILLAAIRVAEEACGLAPAAPVAFAPRRAEPGAGLRLPRGAAGLA